MTATEKNSLAKAWIEAVRLRTLPTSIAGVLIACGFAMADGSLKPVAALLCLIFAILAQIASNFANEYYDYRDGLDKPGREGPRRGVTEGDITPRAMFRATFVTLGIACAVGCMLLMYGGLILLPCGICLALLAIGYSAGPYPLSRHALGEPTVLICFGVVPVCLTYYVQAGNITLPVTLASVSTGLMAANVLIVNNYRDREADSSVGKHTLATVFGSKAVRVLYCLNGLVAMALYYPVWSMHPVGAVIIAGLYLTLHFAACTRLRTATGSALNPLLGFTARLMLLTVVAIAILLNI